MKQPTTTHAEAGTLHTEAEPATQVDGTPAEVPATEETPAAAAATTEGEPAPTESKVEDKKAAVKVSDESTWSIFVSLGLFQRNPDEMLGEDGEDQGRGQELLREAVQLQQGQDPQEGEEGQDPPGGWAERVSPVGTTLTEPV